MNRRTMLASGTSLVMAGFGAGCLGGEGDDGDEEDMTAESGEGQFRETEITGENLVVERDGLLNEEQTVFARIKNTAEEPRMVDVQLQVRDTAGEPIGSEYSKTEGPIAPQESVMVRFDIDESAEEVGGYRLEIVERDTDEER